MKEIKHIKVGFFIHNAIWRGGLNYLRNLMSAVTLLSDPCVEPVIFTGLKSTIQNQFFDVKIIRTALLDRLSPAWMVRKTMARITGVDQLLVNLLRREGIQVLSHSSHLGRQSVFPTVGWIPDFQHIHLPQFFTNEQITLRNKGSHDICSECTRLIVSSESALTDLRMFSPTSVHKANILRFVANPLFLEKTPALEKMQQTYDFNSPYFLLPNQFWVHKNHCVVIDALKILKRRGHSLLVLATGPTRDDRNPAYFPSLIQHAKESDVLDVFRVLGQLPFEHLVSLMHHSVALINPSRFEGWSTSVEEAKSIGKQIVLSDISVHREQSPILGIFFNPDDPQDLADKLFAVYSSYSDTLDAVRQEQARVAFPTRQGEFAEEYRSILLRAIEDNA